MKDRLTWIQRLPGWQMNRYVQIAWCFLFIIALLALIGPLVANEKPFYCKLDGQVYFPIFSSVNESTLSVAHPSYSPVDWHTTPFDAILRTPVPYSPTTIDLSRGTTIGPFDDQSQSWRMRHWLGTDIVGRDVLAGMIRGCRISLLIGFGAMLLATIIGVPLGTMAAYWGNRERRLSKSQFLFSVIAMLLMLVVSFFPWTLWMRMGVIVVLCMVWLFVLYRMRLQKQRISIPIDQWIMGAVSIIDGFPAMFLILVLIALLPVKGWLVIAFVIALLRWPLMARYMRAEVFKMKELNYIKAAQLINLPAFRIMRQHIIPFAFRPVMISFIFGVASAILAESTLSFLGIGLPPEEINWGRLLAQSRNHFDAWWLVVFPGCAIFFTLLSLYTIGNAYRRSE